MSNIYVLSAKFENEEMAMEFSEPKYDINEDGDCELWKSIQFRSDQDFVETIYGDDRYDYLRSLIGSECDMVISKCPKSDNTLILIFDSERNADFDPSSEFTNVRYCGKFKNVAWG